MTRNLIRHYNLSQLHFITFSCYRRLPLLSTPQSRTLVLAELQKVRIQQNFSLVGYVIMPNHIHLLITEPKVSTPSVAIQILKQQVSIKLRSDPSNQIRITSLTNNPIPHLLQFWQSRFYDFTVYSHKKKTEKLNYMHANPVSPVWFPTRSIGRGAAFQPMQTPYPHFSPQT